MDDGPIAITPCGLKKKPHATFAGNLYEGPYYKACMAFALSILSKDSVFILSAKHGLLRPGRWIEPYNLRFGMPGAVTSQLIRDQAEEMKLIDRTAIVLGGEDYVQRTDGIFVRRIVVVDLVKKAMLGSGIGYQLSWLNKNRGRLPDLDLLTRSA